MRTMTSKLKVTLTTLLGTMAFHSATAQGIKVPEELEATIFSDNTLTPCVAAMCAHPDGSVFAGVDKIGSLGKGSGKGSIIKLVDDDNDGVHDSHTIFATIDNPRGLIAIGDKLYVLHSKWDPEQNAKYEYCALSVLEDENADGEADGPPKILVKGISAPMFNEKRGVDHTTNGIRMGIDGWIYVAVGDFGMVDAEGTDGTKLTMLGGGIVRVRPDGTELETYIHGTRNIYDVAIDSFMNIFTRGNTNDGGGWNMRFIHYVQSGEYGYPTLYKRFTDDMIPALVDVGGGSGTGAMFFQEPGWPEKYNNLPLMCDWGRSHLFIHRITPDGASFTQEQENYISTTKITDVDADGSGRMYIGAWGKSGFKGGNDGFVARVVPKGWTYKPFPNLAETSDQNLVKFLRSDSKTTRFHASRAIVNRQGKGAVSGLVKLINDKSALKESRVAAIFTLRQLQGKEANNTLIQASKDPAIREWSLRAIADRISQNTGLDLKPFLSALEDKDPRVQVAAAVALGRSGNPDAAKHLLKVSNPPAKEALPEVDNTPPLFESKPLLEKDYVDVDIDISGAKDFYIVVDPVDGNGEDHAGIFHPQLFDKDGKVTKLTDLKWKKAQQGWGKTHVNKDCRGKELIARNGTKYEYGIGTHSKAAIHYVLKGKYQRFTATLGHTKDGRGKFRIIIDKKLPATMEDVVGPHATPNSAIILPHVAMQSLVKLDASKACLSATQSDNSRGALWALRHMHTLPVVKGLASQLDGATSSAAKAISESLVRLYHKEEPYDGTWWWGTRPDTRGPYYKLGKWDGTSVVEEALVKYWNSAPKAQKLHLANSLVYNRVAIPAIPTDEFIHKSKTEVEEEVNVDLDKIANKQGQVGKMSVEDVIIAMDKIKANPSKGEALFIKQGCIACHAYKKGQPVKGPDMSVIGGIMSKEDIALSILRPNASISQGFHSYLVTMKDNTAHSGFITAELDGIVTLRNIAGQVHKLKAADIKSRKDLGISMMPPGLANGLSLQEFTDMVTWLKGKTQ